MGQSWKSSRHKRKLDIAQAILTAIAWGDSLDTHKTIADTYDHFGAVYPDAPDTAHIDLQA